MKAFKISLFNLNQTKHVIYWN